MADEAARPEKNRAEANVQRSATPERPEAQAPETGQEAVTEERVSFPAQIGGREYKLEAMVYRPQGDGPFPLVVFSHGRNGMRPARNPKAVFGCAAVCRALAAKGMAVVYVVRRGYGGSDGPDSELQGTALASGLEAAKDYQAAVAYWREKEFVIPDRVVLMGLSQGGWAVLACTNVAMEGVVGVANISGGTNYGTMGTGAVTPEVQDHWVEGCRELGRGARIPSFWIYSENDRSISGPTARRMHEAFTAAGGKASLLMLPPFGENGHSIVGEPALFIDQLNSFLGSIGFSSDPSSAMNVESKAMPALTATP